MLTAALWFFAGGVLHKILSVIFSVNDAKQILQETEDVVIILLDAIDHDVTTAVAKKHQILIQDETSDQDIVNRIVEEDLRFIAKWKTFVISKMILSSPKRYFKHFRYLTWEDSLVRLAELKKNINSVKEERDVN